MTVVAGYKTTLKKSGTSTAANAEPVTFVSGKTYQITNTAKRVWDRTVVPIVYVDAVDESAEVLSIDYLFGKVTFVGSYTVSGTVTVTVNYVPLAVVAQAHKYTLSMQTPALDDTDYATAQANGGFKTRIASIKDVKVAISRWDDLAAVYTGIHDAGTAVLIEITPGGSTRPYARGWFVVESADGSGDIDALEAEELAFSANADEVGTFGWSDI